MQLLEDLLHPSYLHPPNFPVVIVVVFLVLERLQARHVEQRSWLLSLWPPVQLLVSYAFLLAS